MKKPFKQLWKLLCKLGWKAKRPTGLGVDFRYVRPGANAKGKEGIDVFTDPEDPDLAEGQDPEFPGSPGKSGSSWKPRSEIRDSQDPRSQIRDPPDSDPISQDIRSQIRDSQDPRSGTRKIQDPRSGSRKIQEPMKIRIRLKAKIRDPD
ncbi:hypothetical protein DVH05_017125 [Phytophthora capsici]|nr:hypothetical protein DVH05_017125 [Phytophthora capsici]